MKHLLGLQLWHLFKYAELTEVVRQKVNCLSTFLINVKLVTLIMVLKSYRRQDLYMNLTKIIQKMSCICM